MSQFWSPSFLFSDSLNLAGCGPDSGACLLDAFSRSFNLGNFNSTLAWSSNEELTLKYSTRNSTDRNETLIRFRCGPMRNETHIVFIERRSGITFLDVFTSLVCTAFSRNIECKNYFFDFGFLCLDLFPWPITFYFSTENIFCHWKSFDNKWLWGGCLDPLTNKPHF